MLTKKQFESTSKLFSYCTELYKQKKTPPLNAFVVFPIGEITPEKISKLARRRKLKFNLKKTAENIYIVKVGVRKKIVAFQLVINKGWWLFLGDGQSPMLRRVLIESFIGNHFPWALEPTYIDTNQLSTILENLAGRFDQVSITGCRYYQPGVTKLEFRRQGFQIRFHAELLKQLEDDTNGTLSAIKMGFGYPDSLENKVRILTQSQMTFYRGYFTDFYQSIVLPYVEESLNTRKRFSNRERRVEPRQVVLNPTTIKYREEFTANQAEELQKVLVSQYSTSIGYYNPVMIAHITDRRDGSCFDIYLDSDSIQIVPLTRATSGSFTQLFSLLAKYSPQIVDVIDKPYLASS